MDSQNVLSELIADDKQPGLYLFCPDNECICITYDAIDEVYEESFNNPSLFPQEIKDSADIALCERCPGKVKGEQFCAALKPILPFLSMVDKYVSYDKVIAVYKDEENNSIKARGTTMQEALMFVSELSLIYYCKANEKYWCHRSV